MKEAKLFLFVCCIALSSLVWSEATEQNHNRDMQYMQQHMSEMKAHMEIMKQMKQPTTNDQRAELNRHMEQMILHMEMMLTLIDNMYHPTSERKVEQHKH